MSGVLELLVVALVVGAALAYVLSKSLRAAKALAKGQAPSCCTDKDGFEERAGRSSCADADGIASPAGGSAAGGSAAPEGFVSPCAGCTGCKRT